MNRSALSPLLVCLLAGSSVVLSSSVVADPQGSPYAAPRTASEERELDDIPDSDEEPFVFTGFQELFQYDNTQFSILPMFPPPDKKHDFSEDYLEWVNSPILVLGGELPLSRWQVECMRDLLDETIERINESHPDNDMVIVSFKECIL